MEFSTEIKQEIETITTTLTMLDIRTYIEQDSDILNNYYYDINFELKQTKYRVRFVLYKDQFNFLSFNEIHRAKSPVEPMNIIALFENNDLKEGTEETLLYITKIIKRNETITTTLKIF